MSTGRAATASSSQTNAAPAAAGHHRAPDLSLFAQQVLSCARRSALTRGCPALLLYVYQYVVVCLGTGRRPFDPFKGTYRQDSLSALLGVTDTETLYRRIFGASEAVERSSLQTEEAVTEEELWWTLRRALELLWLPDAQLEDTVGTGLRFLYEVNGKVRFHFPDTKVHGRGMPLKVTSLQNAMEESRRQLRRVSSCALAGSAEALRSSAALCEMVQNSHLTPSLRGGGGSHAKQDGLAADDLVTPEGINFCMMSLQRQWWVLVSAALDRVMSLTKSSSPPTSSPPRRASAAAGLHEGEVSKPLLWQLLSVLFLLDTTNYMFQFPDKTDDPAANQLISRLAEVGLVYLIKREEKKCFVLSPHFRHALDWHSTTPLCVSSLLTVPGSDAAEGQVQKRMRREDTDTIITETNFRLYAYSSNEDLLQIVGQFAEREETVLPSALVAFRVTRDSFSRALKKGISAAQVLTFLSLKAHPSMLQRYGEDPHASARSVETDVTAGAGNNSPNTELAVPQSFCDQLLTWEKEFSRVVFQKHLVLLRNLTAEQQTFVLEYLTHMGEAEAVTHTENGMLVVQEGCYTRLLAPYIKAT